jgi:hypothetical protein
MRRVFQFETAGRVRVEPESTTCMSGLAGEGARPAAPRPPRVAHLLRCRATSVAHRGRQPAAAHTAGITPRRTWDAQRLSGRTAPPSALSPSSPSSHAFPTASATFARASFLPSPLRSSLSSAPSSRARTCAHHAFAWPLRRIFSARPPFFSNLPRAPSRPASPGPQYSLQE